LKLLLSGQQDEMLALLDTYYPEWRDAGLTFAEMLGAGIEDGKGKIQMSLSDTLALINGVGGASAQRTPVSVQTPPSGFIGMTSPSLSSDVNRSTASFFSDIHSVLAGIAQSIKQGAAEIYAQFENPMRNEFNGMGMKLDSVTSAINDVRSMLSSMPNISITNNFNGVTAADVPHMVDRENTALLRRLSPRLA
jgi:hypothetical protein